MDELLILTVLEMVLLNQQALLDAMKGRKPERDCLEELILQTDDTLRLLRSGKR